MPVTIPEELIADDRLGVSDRWTYVCLRHLAGDGTEIEVNLIKLVEVSKLSKPTIVSSLQNLHNKGWIKKTTTPSKLTRYHLYGAGGRGGKRVLVPDTSTEGIGQNSLPTSVKNSDRLGKNSLPLDRSEELSIGKTILPNGQNSLPLDETQDPCNAGADKELVIVIPPSRREEGVEGEEGSKDQSVGGSMGTPLDDLGDRIRALVMASPKSRIKQRFVLTPKSEYPELRDLEKLRWDRFIAILLLFKKSQIQKTVRDSLPGAKRSPAGYLYTVFQTASDQLDVDPQATPLTIPPAGDWTIVNGKVVNV